MLALALCPARHAMSAPEAEAEVAPAPASAPAAAAASSASGEPAPEKLPQRDGVKIILLGDSAVGKSKLVERFLMDG